MLTHGGSVSGHGLVGICLTDKIHMSLPLVSTLVIPLYHHGRRHHGTEELKKKFVNHSEFKMNAL